MAKIIGHNMPEYENYSGVVPEHLKGIVENIVYKESNTGWGFQRKIRNSDPFLMSGVRGLYGDPKFSLHSAMQLPNRGAMQALRFRLRGAVDPVTKKRFGFIKPDFPIFEEFGFTVGGLNLRDDPDMAIQNLLSRQKIAKHRMATSLFGESILDRDSESMGVALEQILKASPKYTGVETPKVQVSPIFGTYVGGLYVPETVGPMILGQPRAATAPGTLGYRVKGAWSKDPNGLVIRPRVPVNADPFIPVNYVQAPITVTNARMTRASLGDTVARAIQNAERPGKDVQNIVNEMVDKYSTYEATGYAGWMQQHFGMGYFAADNEDPVALADMINAARTKSVEAAVEAGKSFGGYSYATQIAAFEEHASDIAMKFAGKAHIGLSSPQSFMERGIISAKGPGFFRPFGMQADRARNFFQYNRRGVFAKEAADKVKSILPGGRKYKPGVLTPEMARAELHHQTMHGSPSGVMTKIFIATETEAGKPFAMLGGMGQAIASEEYMAMIGVRDLTANAALQRAGRKAIHGGLNSLVYESAFGKQGWATGSVSVQAAGGKFTIMGVGADPRLKDFFSRYHLLTTGWKAHKKAPAEFRASVIESILGQIGPLKQNNPQVAASQKRLLKDIATALAGKNKYKKSVLGKATATWERESKDAGILPQLYIGEETALDYNEMRRITKSVHKHNALMRRLGYAGKSGSKDYRIVAGFKKVIENLVDVGTGKMTKVKGVQMITPSYLRETPHTVEALTNIVGPTGSGFAAGDKGAKITDLTIANLRGTRTTARNELANLLDRMRKGEPGGKRALKEINAATEILEGDATFAYVKHIPKKILAKKDIMYGGERVIGDAPAFVKMLESKGILEALRLPHGTIENPKQLMALMDMFGGQGTRIHLPQAFTTESGAAVKQVYIPAFNMWESAISHGLSTNDPQFPRSFHAFIKSIKTLAEGFDPKTGQVSKEFVDTYTKALSTFASESVGKDKLIRNAMEPRLAGSGYLAMTSAFRNRAAAQAYGGVAADLGFAEVMVNPKTAESMGLSKEMIKKQLAAERAMKGATKGARTAANDMFGLMIAYPEQGLLNALPVRVRISAKIAAGAVAMNDTARTMFRDFDYDQVRFILNPFSTKKASRKWQQLLKASWRETRQLFGKLVPGIESEAAVAVAESAGPLSKPISWFKKESESFERIVSALSSDDVTVAKAAYQEALGSAPGPLFKYLQENPTSYAAKMDVSRYISTKASTGPVVNALLKLREYTDFAAKEQIGAATFRPKELITATEGVAAKARAALNQATLISQSIEGGAIEKGALSMTGLIELSEAYWADGDRKKVRDAIKLAMQENVKKGIGYIVPEASTLEKESEAVANLVIEGLDITGAEKVFFKRNLYEKLTGMSGDMMESGVALSELSEMRRQVAAGDITTKSMKDKANLLRTKGFGPTDASSSRVLYSARADLSESNALIQDLLKARSEVEHLKIQAAKANKYWDAVEGTAKMIAKPAQWLTRPMMHGEKFYHAKRLGVLVGGALMGAAILKAALFPNIVPSNDDENSYVEKSPPLMQGSMTHRDLGYSVTTGSSLPYVAPSYGPEVGAANHPVIVGPGMSAPLTLDTSKVASIAGVNLPPPSNLEALSSPYPSIASNATRGPILQLGEDSSLGWQGPVGAPMHSITSIDSNTMNNYIDFSKFSGKIDTGSLYRIPPAGFPMPYERAM